MIKDCWDEKKYKKLITWISTPQHPMAAMACLTYGNEASLEMMHSYAAKMDEITSWNSHQLSGE